MEFAQRVHTAYGDGWQAEGRLRTPYGGGALELPGIRLSASGLPSPAYNNGDVDDPAVVDLDAVRAFYAERALPWGVRVPAGLAWPYGRRLLRLRCMGLEPADLEPAAPAEVVLRRAGPDDADRVVAVDAAAFEGDTAESRAWAAPRLTQAADGVATVVLAEFAGEPVGVAVAVLADGRARRSVTVSGVAVLASARRRGFGTAMTSWLLTRAFAAGAGLAVLCPDTEEAARIYRRLGFTETDGLDVYVEN